jgi:hypothetical protein
MGWLQAVTDIVEHYQSGKEIRIRSRFPKKDDSKQINVRML